MGWAFVPEPALVYNEQVFVYEGQRPSDLRHTRYRGDVILCATRERKNRQDAPAGRPARSELHASRIGAG
ncbi:MAG: hypothetical protein MI924_07265 [Chloroflexales bacterium]|nr:hypothetical protein [Chloroflexales bacterium]